jgi:hypothetical protein
MMILYFLLSTAAASVSYSLAGPAPVLSVTDGPAPILTLFAEAQLGFMDPEKKKTWGWKDARKRSFLPGGNSGRGERGGMAGDGWEWLGMAGDGWGPLGTAGDRWGLLG